MTLRPAESHLWRADHNTCGVRESTFTLLGLYSYIRILPPRRISFFTKRLSLRCEAVWSDRSLLTFRRNVLLPSSGSKSNSASRLLGLCRQSSETSVSFYQTTRDNIPEKCTLHGYCRKNLKSNFCSVYLNWYCFLSVYTIWQRQIWTAHFILVIRRLVLR
jgi:hypothetical protein